MRISMVNLRLSAREFATPRFALRTPHFSRRGFTLVEMLVAAAVAILLMVIISQAFAAGLDVFRRLKAVGDMQERLRMASITLRDDLTRPHFGATGTPATGAGLAARRLHESYASAGAYSPDSGQYPGCVRIWQGQMTDLSGVAITEPGPGGASLPFALEGTDQDGLMFARATTHVLQLTVRRRGTSLDEMFRTRDYNRTIGANIFPRDYVFPSDYREEITGTAPPESYFTSRLAEVAYFLVPTGEVTAGGLVRLYMLVRRVKLIVPERIDDSNNFIPSGEIPVTPPWSPEISTRTQLTPAGQRYNRIKGDAPFPNEGISQPFNRFGMSAAPLTAAPGPPTVPHNPNVAGLPATLPGPAGSPLGGPFTPTRDNVYPSLAQEQQLMADIWGNDVLLHNVVSFEIKAWWDVPAANPPAITPEDVAALQPRRVYNYPGFGPVVNSDYPFDYIPYSRKNVLFMDNAAFNPSRARVFDTWCDAPGSPYATLNPAFGPEWKRTDTLPWTPGNTAARLPVPVRIKSLQITIRIWDQKSEQTRRITIVQDM